MILITNLIRGGAIGGYGSIGREASIRESIRLRSTCSGQTIIDFREKFIEINVSPILRKFLLTVDHQHTVTSTTVTQNIFRKE